MPIETIEQAQERILELETQLTELTNERDTLSENNKNLSHDLEAARTLNQKLFERVTTKETPEDDDEGDDVESCEDFAKKLSF